MHSLQLIIAKIRSLPGNNRCVDCGAPDPPWLSVNLGILMCINCSGRHRELSVQYSRIRSLTLDKLKTTELLVSCQLDCGLECASTSYEFNQVSLCVCVCTVCVYLFVCTLLCTDCTGHGKRNS